MPFATVSELPKTIRDRFDAKAQRAFMGAFNSAFAGTCSGRNDQESCAFAIATAAANRVGKAEAFEHDIRILKQDDEQQIVFGVVLEPETEDTQGDVITEEDVELAAHRFLAAYVMGKSQLGLDHEALVERQQAIIVESYVTPEAIAMDDGSEIRKGAWIIGVHIPDVEIWKSLKDSERTGFSIGGTGLREEAA